MPLFVCSKCESIENTALGAYWAEKENEVKCSECAYGKWHGKFSKIHYKEYIKEYPDSRIINLPKPPKE